ncbi:MAG: GxxExxY protein, partial [Saprospiraceae bacterium]
MKDFSNYKHSEVTGKVIEAAYFVYNELGHGFLESVYEKALEIQLTRSGMKAVRQQPVEVYFCGELIGDFRADLVVNDTVIVELKA